MDFLNGVKEGFSNVIVGARDFAVGTVRDTTKAVAEPAGDALGSLLKQLGTPLLLMVGGFMALMVLMMLMKD